MNPHASLLLRLVLVGLLGYVVIALFQTLFLELLLGGRVAPDAAPSIQAAGIAGTVVSGLVGGYLAAWIGGSRPLLCTAAVLVPLALDTIFVLANTEDPLWFSLAGSLTLMAATMAGGLARARRRGRAGPRLAAAELE